MSIDEDVPGVARDVGCCRDNPIEASEPTNTFPFFFISFYQIVYFNLICIQFD